MEGLFGYCDKWSVQAGDRLKVMVSSSEPGDYDVQLARLRQPDAGPDASPFAPEWIAAPGLGPHPGRRQTSPLGSFAVAPGGIGSAPQLTLALFVRPTRPGSRQALLGLWQDDRKLGLGLELAEDGTPRLLVGAPDAFEVFETGRPLVKDRWHLVVASLDVESGQAAIGHRMVDPHDLSLDQPIQVRRACRVAPAAHEGPVTMAAWPCGTSAGPSSWGGLAFGAHFEGRIDRPRIIAGALGLDDVAPFLRTDLCATSRKRVLAAWDLSLETTTDRIVDVGPDARHGCVVNQPMRAAAGANWTGRALERAAAPSEYGAIHFHADDLADARWEPDFEFEVPAGLPSGVYGLRLSAGSREAWIPFTIRPSTQAGRPATVFLLPTATYLAYLNHRSRFQSLANERLYGRLNVLDRTDIDFIGAPQLGLSTYDRHADGSGVAYASRLRAAANLRPTGRLWNFPVDLFIIDWLESLGEPYDVVTDEDLHREGEQLLRPYRVVITGSHPEYVSDEMLDGLEAHLRRGGRLVYMGGNGFYWRIAFHPQRPEIMEVRRSEGVRAWTVFPGEIALSFTGEAGGLWRQHARAPQRLVGVGFVSQGFDESTCYHLTSQARDARVSWMFEGVEGPTVGDHGLLQGGAAGIEIDATDPALGTPAHALVVARSGGHSNTYEMATEEVQVPHGGANALLNDGIRAEMVFFEAPGGGAVFSSGSIAFAGALPTNGFNNDIARLMQNVVRRFVDPTPFPMPPERQPHEAGSEVLAKV